MVSKSINSLLLLSVFLYSSITISGERDTPNYYKCTNRTGGEWNFGRAPYVCDLDHFADNIITTNNYPEFLFIDDQNRSHERDRYMTSMHALLKDFITYYFERRNPNASQEEARYFTRALFALFHQESFWSHYRITPDSRLKYMRGDFGHGHGIGQIDDRWHFVSVEDGTAARLVPNLIYAIDIYYEAWEKSSRASCVRSNSDFIARIRSAYSAYNGGKSRICRWTNKRDRWYRNDEAYFEKYNSETWNRYVLNKEKTLNLNYECLAQAGVDCPRDPSTPAPVPKEPKSDVLYKTDKGQFCHFDGEEFNCIDHIEDKACLVKQFSLDPNIKQEVLDQSSQARYRFNLEERQKSCRFIDGHISIGEFIETKKNIFHRITPGEKALHLIPKSTRLQVLDFVYTLPDRGRYYKVSYKGDIGFIYLGDFSDFDKWYSKLDSSDGVENKIIAQSGDKVQIHKNIYMRDETLDIIKLIPASTKFEVKSVMIHEALNSVRYEGEVDGDSGFIYVGATRPEIDIADWVSIINENSDSAPPANQFQAYNTSLKDRYYYTYMRSCPSYDCKSITYVLGPKYSKRTFKVTNQVTGKDNSEWVEIEYKNKLGFLRKEFIKK